MGEINDPDILLKYVLWLAPRDVDKALSVGATTSRQAAKADVQILMNTSGKAGLKLDDAALIEELRRFSDEAAKRYLQHVVVAKKLPNRKLHQDLLDSLMNEAEQQVQDDGVKYHLEELGTIYPSLSSENRTNNSDAEYRLLNDPQPYCVFLAEVAPKTPIKSVRLKLLLFLQGSPFFDLSSAADRLEKIDQLKPELAVILGRVRFPALTCGVVALLTDALRSWDGIGRHYSF